MMAFDMIKFYDKAFLIESGSVDSRSAPAHR